MKVRVYGDRCVGHGRCYVLAPDVFAEDERGHCVVEREEVPAGLEGQALIGESNCPEHAIEVREA